MTLILSLFKQFRCRIIERDCGSVLIGERHEKPKRKTYFRCGKCNRKIAYHEQER